MKDVNIRARVAIETVGVFPELGLSECDACDAVLRASGIMTKIVAVNWGEIGSFDLKTNVVSFFNTQLPKQHCHQPCSSVRQNHCTRHAPH